jgi:GrpB-like predicted nucleotidyltransferase (UPF0157 family)
VGVQGARARGRDEHLRRCAGLAVASQPPRHADILRADPGLREQYAAVKRRAGAMAANIDEYGRGKNAMVQKILTPPG